MNSSYFFTLHNYHSQTLIHTYAWIAIHHISYSQEQLCRYHLAWILHHEKKHPHNHPMKGIPCLHPLPCGLLLCIFSSPVGSTTSNASYSPLPWTTCCMTYHKHQSHDTWLACWPLQYFWSGTKSTYLSQSLLLNQWQQQFHLLYLYPSYDLFQTTYPRKNCAFSHEKVNCAQLIECLHLHLKSTQKHSSCHHTLPSQPLFSIILCLLRMQNPIFFPLW